MGVLHLGVGLYAINLLVGLAAQLGRRFGVWHHVLYALVFGAAIAASIASFHPALLITVLALAAMPKTRPGTRLHPLIALVGLSGYVIALFDAWEP